MFSRDAERAFAGSARFWIALGTLACALFSPSAARAQEEEEGYKPEPYFYEEKPVEESAFDQDLRICQETFGYVGCAEQRYGKPGMIGPRPKPKPDVWGALALSPSTLQFGMSWNEKSEAAAKQSALSRCQAKGAGDCRIQVSVADVCVAAAFSKPQHLFRIGGPTGAGNFADDAAMLKCQRAGGKSCVVQASFCADGERHELQGETVLSNGNPIFVPGRAPGAPSRSPAADDDTERFFGTWTTEFTANGKTATLLSEHDNQGYRNFWIADNGRVSAGSGTFTAAHGRYQTSAPAPNDTGTYHFMDTETVVCVNAAGQKVTWRRQSKPQSGPVDANTAAKRVINYTPPTQRPGVLNKK